MADLRPLIGLALLAAAGWLVYLLAPILMPFIVGALLAYVCNPLVTCLAAWRLPRVLAVALVFVVVLAAVAGLLLFLVPVMQRQVTAFVLKIPAYLDWLQQNVFPRVLAATNGRLPADMLAVKQAVVGHWQELGDWLGIVIGSMTQSGLRFLAWLVNLVLIPIVTFYLLLDWDRIPARALSLFPASVQPRIRRLGRETDEVLGSFLRGQLTVMTVLATVYATGLGLVGLDLALPLGLLAGLISFVPYLGFIAGALTAGVAAYLQFHEATALLWVLAVFLAGQVLDGLVLTPRLVGGRIGLHPVAVIFAIMAGGQLFGFLGILLALPAAAAIKVWLRHLHEGYGAPRRQRAPR
ncbi:MAG: hypothetical protein A2637_07435 [Candidatus Muproteobacteria bacterium RIFCSPHIGHO2_01_FULL_65_16]|uniref:AI-2E family transporter n=1 Tax=Candidatus Muproteobacteria bacterium RIFCSPHIGHO2_01_FULL_65_16 TaxID=1817764 RepID=A0A1F6TRS8_9PROT|nr:MAG: hypothetical protein A2637_07435 [Candidatus Muproteobacteria bacterium RIFCSPHIGHO2_01_FULL_65_16]